MLRFDGGFLMDQAVPAGVEMALVVLMLLAAANFDRSQALTD